MTASTTEAPRARVATSRDEALLLPQGHIDVPGPFEAVYDVTVDDEGREVIAGGIVVDTEDSTWFSVRVDVDAFGRGVLIRTSEKTPCDDD